MGIREIPRAFEYTCDNCGEVHRQDNAGGHYSNSRPPHWARLKFERAAYEGNIAMADASVERLLCGGCASKAAAAINSIAP